MGCASPGSNPIGIRHWPAICTSVAGPARSLAAALVTFETQPLLSHARYFFIKLRGLFVAPRVFRCSLIALAQLFKRFPYGKFIDFSHRQILIAKSFGIRPIARLECGRTFAGQLPRSGRSSRSGLI